MAREEIRCENCGGKGTTINAEKCPICKGDGRVIVGGMSLLMAQPSVAPAETCGLCHGRGVLSPLRGTDHRCPACNGDRQIVPAPLTERQVIERGNIRRRLFLIEEALSELVLLIADERDEQKILEFLRRWRIINDELQFMRDDKPWHEFNQQRDGSHTGDTP